MDIMNYTSGQSANENWIVEESRFDHRFLGKCEAIFALGNGYMGQRAAMEEKYIGETRNLFVAGTFNKFSEDEVTELPNAADVLWLDFWVNGCHFNLKEGKIIKYRRYLHLKKAELIREVEWVSPKGELFSLKFRRFVSLADKHVIAMQAEITPLSGPAKLLIKSGINGRMTNSGASHFAEGGARFYDGRYMQITQRTTQSNINFVFNSAHNFHINNKPYDATGHVMLDRRQIYFEYSGITVEKGQSIVIEKLSNVFTDRDKDNHAADLHGLKQVSLEHMRATAKQSYSELFARHKEAWREKVWDAVPISVQSQNPYDQLAIRFAQYHLTIMTPAHDNRMGVAAKGISGEGYKGHSFWDTEIFILPYFIYAMPDVARSLLEYRHNTLSGARKKAKENGYDGAMFPWESAWMDDGEVTPLWGAADIITGEPIKIWTGIIEQHITSDIAYAVWQYFKITGDADFMEKCGYEIILDTAKFWVSRLEYNEAKQEYHINNVIGPDEYKEHVNNDAFTNYMAHWNILKAMEYCRELKNNHRATFDRLNEKLGLEDVKELWRQRADKIYLPQPRPQDNVIPQDDTYLTKPIIDLSKYKKQENVGSIYRDYNQDQIVSMQVSKQANIVILFYLLPDLFEEAVKRANWDYYEPKTLHDSSLSLSTHSIIACEMGDMAMAYELFVRAANIDLGPNMKTSDMGIHAASLGGIWQCVVNGFGGVRMVAGELHITPRLPDAWDLLSFPIYWKGERMEVKITKDGTWLNGEKYENNIIIKE